MDKTYISVLNPLRAIAALGVCLVHFGGLGLFGNSILSSIFSNGQLGVYIFFVISGFIIPYSLNKSKYRIRHFFKYILRRSARIDPPYFVAIILTIFLSYLVTIRPGYAGENFNFNILQLLAHITYTVPLTKYTWYSHVFWTLCIEFQYYIFIGLFFNLLIQNHILASVFILFIVSLSGYLNFYHSYYCISTYSPIFCTGIITFFYQIKKIGSYSFLFLVGAFVLVYYLETHSYAVSASVIITAIVIAYSNYSGKLLDFIGKISYSLYVTHGLIVLLFGFIVKRFIMSFGFKILLLVAEMSVAILFAWLFYWLVEERSIRLSKKVKIY